MRKEFKPYSPRKQSLEMIRQIEKIVKKNKDKGFKINSKQLHYQMVRAGYLPFTHNTFRSLSRTLNLARLGGMMDWDLLLESYDCMYRDASQIREIASQEGEIHKELWTDRLMQMSILIEMADDDSIPVRSTGGYPTSNWILDKVNYFNSLDKPVHIIMVTDLTFAGTIIVEDLINRFELLGLPQSDMFKIERIEFNHDLALKLCLPKVKEKDINQRKQFESKYGQGSFELESIPPETLYNLVQDKL